MSGTAARTVAVRVATEEVDAARSKLEAIGDVGDRAFARIAQSAQNAANAFARVSTAADQDIYAKRAADIAAYGAEMDRLRAKFDPLFAAQQRHKAVVQEIAQAERVGAIDSSTAAAARERANRAHQDAVAPMRGAVTATQQLAGHQAALASSTGVTAYQMRALAQQMPDVVQGLLGGQRPFQILVQQGGQVVQVAGGVGAAFRTLTAFVGGPWVLAFAAGALAVGGLVGRSADLTGETRSLGVALQAVGKDAEIAAGQLAGYIRALERQGTGRADARGIVTELARTPGLSGTDIGRITSIAPDLAAGTGTSVQEAAKQAASLFTGGYDAVRKLDDALNFLTADQRSAIRTMLEHGQRTEALGVAFGALDKRMKGLRDESLSPTKKAVEELGKGWTDFLDRLAQSSAIETAERGLSRLATAAGSAMGAVASLVTSNLEQTNAQIAGLEKQLADRDSYGQPTVAGPAAAAIRQRIADLRSQAMIQGGAVTGGAANAPTAAATALGGGRRDRTEVAGDASVADLERQRKAVGDLTLSYADQQRVLAASLPDRVRVRAEIQAEREAGENRLTGLQREEFIRRRVAEAMAAETDARAQEVASLDREAAGALAVGRAADQGRAAMLRATAAVEAHQKAATQTGASEAALTASILNRNAAQETSKGAEAVVALNEQNASLQRLIAAEKAGARPAYYATLDERIRDATRSMEAHRDAATDPAVKAALQTEIDLVRQRTLEQERLNSELDTQRKLRAGSRELEDLAQEARLVGVSADQRERELAARRALRSLGDGVDPNNMTETQRAFVEQAKTIADANTSLRRQRDLYDEIGNAAVQAFDQVGSAITSAFVGGQGAAVNWGNVTRGVLTSVLQEASKLGVINPLMNAAFGTSRPSLFDVAGSAGSNNSGGIGGGGGFGGITQMFGLSGIGEQLGLPSFGSLFGSGGFSGLMQTPLWGGSVAGPPTAAGIAASGAPTIGGYLGGVGLGFGAGSMIGGLINPQHSSQAMIGAGLGAAVGSIWGPVGGLIGGVIGGVGGSFFGPGPAHHGYAWGISGDGTNGFRFADRVYVDPIAQQQYAAEQQQVAQANALLARYGVGVSGQIEIGGTAPGMGGRNARQVDSFNAGFGAFRFSAANDNKLGGFLDGRGFSGLDDLATGLSFVKETLPGLLTPLGAFDQQMKALTDSFDAAQKSAEHFGYAEDELTTKRAERAADLTARRDNSAAALTASYAQRYARATGGDGQAASLAAFDAAAAQERIDLKDRIRDLGLADTQYAADRILDIERTLAAERLAITKAYADQSKGLLTELTLGTSSALAPEQRYFAGLSLLNQARQSFDAGGSVDDFARVAQQVLPVVRDYLGTSERYASLTAEIAAAVTSRTGDASGLGAILQAQVDGTDAMRDVLASLGQQQVAGISTLVSEFRRLASTLEALIARQNAA